MGGIKRAIREHMIGRKGDWGVSIADRAIREQDIGGRVISEQANLGASDWGVIEKKNTVIDE